MPIKNPQGLQAALLQLGHAAGELQDAPLSLWPHAQLADHEGAPLSPEEALYMVEQTLAGIRVSIQNCLAAGSPTPDSGIAG